MQPLLILSWLQKSISIDIIIKLLLSANTDLKVYNAILIVVDYFIKIAKYFLVKTTITAVDLVKLFYQYIICSFETLLFIIIDYTSFFTSQYQLSLYFYIKARQKLSTVFYLQTDKQIERQNQTLEYYLYCYINYRQND